MRPYFQAICWAFAGISIALGGAFGLVPAPIANMIVIILPILMLTTVAARRRRCGAGAD